MVEYSKNKDLILNLFDDFNLLKKFKVDKGVQKKMLKELLEAGPNPWRVVGITSNALSLFKEHGYKKAKNIKIQRAHLVDRDEWYSKLLEQDWDNALEWYKFIYENDRTVLALSVENKRIKKINFINFEGLGVNLFKSTRISWKHGNVEIEFLRRL